MRVNFTTYDVRQSQDVLHPSTSHHNIMVLTEGPDEGDDLSDDHRFAYARILGIYHANVVYTGPGMVDYQYRRVDFLWVRWYERTQDRSGWHNLKLDRVQFPPMVDRDAFGFVDPSDVLRSCHIIPAFSSGKVHTDGKGLSVCAHDSSDLRVYYVNR
jgi:hypothetical protein